MTRKEQIEAAAIETGRKEIYSNEWYDGFTSGAEWADANPQPPKYFDGLYVSAEERRKFEDEKVRIEGLLPYEHKLNRELSTEYHELKSKLQASQEREKILVEALKKLYNAFDNGKERRHRKDCFSGKCEDICQECSMREALAKTRSYCTQSLEDSARKLGD